MINAGKRRLPAGSRGLGWIRKTGAVLPVVVGSAGLEGVVGGELHGGGGFGSNGVLGLWWFPIAYERLGSSARLRGVEWCRWMGGGGPGCEAWCWGVVAAEPAGVEEDGFPLMISGFGGAMGVARGHLGARMSSGDSFYSATRSVLRRPWISSSATAVL